MTDRQRLKLAELMGKPLVELTVAEAIFLALVLDDSEDGELEVALEERGLPIGEA